MNRSFGWRFVVAGLGWGCLLGLLCGLGALYLVSRVSADGSWPAPDSGMLLAAGLGALLGALGGMLVGFVVALVAGEPGGDTGTPRRAAVAGLAAGAAVTLLILLLLGLGEQAFGPPGLAMAATVGLVSALLAWWTARR